MTQDTPIVPALSKEEWAKQLSNTAGNKRGGESEVGLGVYAYLRGGDEGAFWEAENDSINYGGSVRPHLVMQWDTVSECDALHDRHKLAALCLHGQPYGFSQADVELVRRMTECDGTIGADDENRVYPDGIVMRMKDVRRLHSLVSRISALLKPEEK